MTPRTFAEMNPQQKSRLTSLLRRLSNNGDVSASELLMHKEKEPAMYASLINDFIRDGLLQFDPIRLVSGGQVVEDKDDDEDKPDALTLAVEGSVNARLAVAVAGAAARLRLSTLSYVEYELTRLTESASTIAETAVKLPPPFRDLQLQVFSAIEHQYAEVLASIGIPDAGTVTAQIFLRIMEEAVAKQ